MLFYLTMKVYTISDTLSIIVAGFLIITWLSNYDSNMVSDTQEVSLQPSSYSSSLPNTSLSSLANPKRTHIIGNGNDVFTIMIFMCGTDLESQSGMATADLKEILNADINEKVNIIVETGGTNSWKTKFISNNTNQRYKFTENGMVLLQDNLGAKPMTDPNTLTEFIKYCKNNFPANRYALIFWDHGGGSISGYGYDQKFPKSSMTLDKIDIALKNSGCLFDFIGFDTCLMATLENALMLSNYSDYMIASEETEPGIGWYYTNWITKLSANTSMSTVLIGKTIIDDFVEQCAAAAPRDKTTLSIIDLAELSGTLPEAFKTFATSTSNLIDGDNYKIVSNARSTAREFGQSAKIDQIDLIHFAQNIGTNEADEMVNILKQSVKYNRASFSDANGISIYFPFDRLSGLSTMLSTYDKIGMEEEYSRCIKNFANLEAGGQIVTSGSSSPLQSLFGGFSGDTGADLISGLLGSFIQQGDFSSLLGSSILGKSWVDTDRIMNSVSYYENNFIDSANIVLTEKEEGEFVLSLSEEEWSLIQSVSLNVFVDDGGGYIDLGLDNVFEFDDDGDLKIDYDGTWLTIDEHVVSYYFLTDDTRDGESIITGRVPALLNGQLVDIIVVFDDENQYGAVAGARIIYSGETETVAKGLIEIKKGDVIDFLCDYYTYNEQYEGSYKLGHQLFVDGELKISNMRIGNTSCKFAYRLTDIYNNSYWTPATEYESIKD